MKHNQGRLVFDTTLQDIDDRFFDAQNTMIDHWRDCYMEAIYPFPHGIPEVLVKYVHII